MVRGGKSRQLTHLNESLLGGKTLGEVSKLPVTSHSTSGRSTPGWSRRPTSTRRSKYPLILEIHGGPFAAYGPTFSTDDQLYAAAGYVVVYANPRGSTSYGEDFANQIDQPIPATTTTT